MKQFLLFIFLTASIFSFGQFNFENRETQLNQLLDSLRSAKTDVDKEKSNNAFKKLLFSTLNEPTIFDLEFTKMRTLGVIDSPDKLLRIFNWNVEQADGSQKYYGFVVYRTKQKNDEHKVVELEDQSATTFGKTEEILDAASWYGALYYQIIPVERNNKTYYTLLGWIDGSKMSNKKVIDVLSIAGKTVKFGSPVFRLGNTTAKRIFFEYSERAAMTLKYEPEYKRIIFDHLSPESPGMEGMYAYYVPDMSYDAFVFEENRWILLEDVIGINKKQEKVKLSTIDAKTEQPVTKEVESTWVDPTTGMSGTNKGDVHIAVMPSNEISNTTEQNNKSTKVDTSKMTALERYEAEKRHKKDKLPESSITPVKKKSKK